MQSYPTARSRVVAVVALLLIWTFFGARDLHESWATQEGASLVMFAVVAGLLALSRSFNVNVYFRAPANDREKQFVHRLSILKGMGALGIVISMIWLWASPSNDFAVTFVVPLGIFIISFGLEGASAALYRPFIQRDSEAE
jgi:hypothetical protein